ncbi:MAG: hypothetical protein ACRDRV_16415 [Pseudonocardiaceae bacterium]
MLTLLSPRRCGTYCDQIGEQHAHRAAAANAAALRAALIQSAERAVQVMGEIATVREGAAANYRRMARAGGPDAVRYLQQAEQFDVSAARARRFAEKELEQIVQWRQLDSAHDSDPDDLPKGP